MMRDPISNYGADLIPSGVGSYFHGSATQAVAVLSA